MPNPKQYLLVNQPCQCLTIQPDPVITEEGLPMPCLTLDLTTSAHLLGTEPDTLLQFIQREKIQGVLFFAKQPKLSVFTLANLLNTTPETLMNWLEDEALAELIEEVEDDEWFEGEAGRQIYESMIAEQV